MSSGRLILLHLLPQDGRRFLVFQVRVGTGQKGLINCSWTEFPCFPTTIPTLGGPPQVGQEGVKIHHTFALFGPLRMLGKCRAYPQSCYLPTDPRRSWAARAGLVECKRRGHNTTHTHTHTHTHGSLSLIKQQNAVSPWPSNSQSQQQCPQMHIP